VIWGNHSATQVPDFANAVVEGANGKQQVSKFIEAEWVPKFTQTVQQRGAVVIATRGAGSALSAARAIVEHVRSWHVGTPEGEFVSMGVWSNGNTYGTPEKLIYSFPVTIKNGKWTIVKNLTVSDSTKKALKATADELVEERKVALGI
jgi:malate/lactate dehydrogenase